MGHIIKDSVHLLNPIIIILLVCAGVNYYLSVLPFLAAVETGVVSSGGHQVLIQVPAEVAQDYCSSYSDCSTKHPNAMAKWHTFFQVPFLSLGAY